MRPASNPPAASRPHRVRDVVACALLFMIAGCDIDVGDGSTKVNGSIHVAAGQPPVDVKTVNGDIHVDEGAAVMNAVAVNGSLHIGPRATAGDLKTVNGGIELAGAARATELVSVNGDLTLDDAADVAASLTNVNGRISLRGAHVGGDIKTVNGSISILGASRIDGGILVKKPSGGFSVGDSEPVVIIGPGAAVKGPLRFERKVKLYVSDHATIGALSGATPITFSGEEPKLE
jgi:cytoskeletal protein CcmA (bactofilin family)